jgi:hypothetical protein
MRVAIIRGKAAGLLWGLLVVMFIYRDIEQQINVSRTYPRATTASIAPVSEIPGYSDAPSEAQSVSVAESMPEAASATRTREDREALPSSPVSAEQERILNRLKARYEDAFISYMILQECDQAPPDAYRQLTERLDAALAQHTFAPANLADNIRTAARGSFNALYRSSACRPQRLQRVAGTLHAFLGNDADGASTAIEQ